MAITAVTLLSVGVFVTVMLVIINEVSCEDKGAAFAEKICKAEKIEDSKLQAIESCKFKNFLDDQTPVRECEKKIYGEGTSLDEMRKENCKESPEETSARVKTMTGCIMTNAGVRAKFMEKAKALQAMTQEERNKSLADTKEEIISCMEKAYAA